MAPPPAPLHEPAGDEPAPPGRPPAGDGLARVVRALTTGTTHLVSLVEADGTVAYASPSVHHLLGHDPDTLVGTNVLSLVHPDDRGMAISMMASASTEPVGAGTAWGDADISGDYRLRHADGRYVPFELLRNDFSADPAIEALLVVGRPVVARRALDDALDALARDPEGSAAIRQLAAYADVRLPNVASALVLAGAPAEWITTGRVPEILQSDAGPWRTAIATRSEVVVADLLAGDERMDDDLAADAVAAGFRSCWSIPVPVEAPRVYGPDRKDEATDVLGCLVVWSADAGAPLAGHLGVLERICGLAEVVLRRREATRDLQHLVAHDRVTGALSRAGFDAVVEARADEPATLLMVDLDDFKAVNDRHGHATGDAVLRIAVQRIEALLRRGDVLGRLGGDEFVARIGGADLDAAAAVAGRVLAAMDEPITEGNLTLHLRVSVGIAPWDPEPSPTELLRRADAALYTAKRAGKGRFAVWDAGTGIPGGASPAVPG